MLITPNNILNILKIIFFFFYLNASFVSETEMQPDQFNAWQYLCEYRSPRAGTDSHVCVIIQLKEDDS